MWLVKAADVGCLQSIYSNLIGSFRKSFLNRKILGDRKQALPLLLCIRVQGGTPSSYGDLHSDRNAIPGLSLSHGIEIPQVFRRTKSVPYKDCLPGGHYEKNFLGDANLQSVTSLLRL